MARATGRLQRTGVSSRSTSVIPGPNDATVSSMPYGPPLTLKKKMAAIGTSPSSRLRPPVRSRPPGRGDELRELLHPFLDRTRGVHDDLELAAREPAHPARRRGAQRDDQHLPVNAEGVRHHEDRVDFLQGNDLKHPDLPGADRLSRQCPTPGTETSGSRPRPASSARGLALCGYVLKSGSPSCGLLGVPVYREDGERSSGDGRGLFAAALAERLPALPIEEEGRLANPVVQRNFIERVLAAAGRVLDREQ